MPGRFVLTCAITLLFGCRTDEPPVEDRSAQGSTTPEFDATPWGIDAQPPSALELPAELASLVYEPQVESAMAIPPWQIAVVEPGTSPRPLGYRPARVARRVRTSLGEGSNPQPRLTTTLHWWSFASSDAPDQGQDFGFAGIDCEPGAGLAEPLDCAQILGQARVQGSRLTRIAQTRGQPMTPAVPEILELFIVPLPSEPVGIGGTWTATHKTEAMTSTRRYRLAASQADQLTLEFEAKTTFRDQPDEDAKGTLVVSVFDPLARSGTIEVIMRMRDPGANPSDLPDEFPLRLELSPE